MSRETGHLTQTAAVVAFLMVMAHPAAAQAPTPAPTPAVVAPLKAPTLPRLVFDVRGGFASLGSDAATSAGLGVAAADMPGRARTAVIGTHLYLKRKGALKLGVGAEYLLGSGSNQRKDAQGKGVGPVIHRRLTGASGQVSLNFGRGPSWSYITVGSGPMKFESYLDKAEPTRAGSTTLNYGAGARWSTRAHLAFTVDLRFYLTRPATASGDAVARGRQRVSLLSVGVSIK